MKLAARGILLLILTSGMYAQEQSIALHKQRGPAVGRALQFPSVTPQAVHQLFSDVLYDSASIWKNVFSLTSMKVIAATIPLFLATKPADHVVHEQFYDVETHTNINQPSEFLQEFTVTDDAVALPFLCFGIFSIFGRQEKLRRQSQVFVTGLLWTYVTKKLLKEIVHHNVGFRPYNQKFPKADICGGIPSGHSALFAYMATYWGMQLGTAWSIGLGTYTLMTMALTVATNRHYLSQVFVGAGLGVLMGAATNKTFDSLKKFEHFSVTFDTDRRGAPALTLAYDF